MKQVDAAAQSGSVGLVDALDPALKRISKAHALLEFEGISLPPFRRPSVDASMAGKKTAAPSTSKTPVPKKPISTKPTTPPPTTPARPKPTDPNAISFTSHVAPILSNRCGRCHIQGSKGQFNLGTFAALMKGPPEGTVVFAGDTVGSRLIETIETGDMPRGGKVPANELAVLKGWIMQGAKFDGTDPNASITGRADANATRKKQTSCEACHGQRNS